MRNRIARKYFRQLKRFRGFPLVAEVLGFQPLCSGRPGAAATLILSLLAALPALQAWAQDAGSTSAGVHATRQVDRPPQLIQAEQFLAARGWKRGQTAPERQNRKLLTVAPAQLRLHAARASASLRAASTLTQSLATATWQPLGPTAVSTASFGLVTGRITSLALDPSDSTGNRLYVGTTGGGVWEAQNAAAAASSSITFTPLTDSLEALGGAPGASISIGAISVQPGGTGVILAGTGDPNDALDSYYGAGILRSTDGGTTWSLIQQTVDQEEAFSVLDYSFVGEGFAGFAWSTVNPQVVVAAVSQAFGGELVGANLPGASYEGLYYSNDAGATWHLATIGDGNGSYVQGPLRSLTSPDGNAATAVVWNPLRKLFLAAVRYHGYYQSADGVTWTRMTVQPGSGLTTDLCPTNPGQIGSIACPIFRGALAVNPQTGDTFAWTVDISNQDQGLWQDACAASNGACSNPSIAFARQWNTSALEANTPSGAATIPNGDYNLALAAVPSQQDTLLFAGANDLWKCSLAMGCIWRNTTNSTTCMSAKVGEFQHALEWNASNPLEIFVGNDSGLWRSADAVGESGSQCDASDSSHFQNLNGALGSLAEAQSISQGAQSPYTMLAGLGVNGSAGVKSTSGPTADWPQVLSGEGGPVQIDPASSTWYVNNQAGVSIHACSQAGDCTPADFGASASVDNKDVSGDGYTMETPAPFLVDPVNDANLLVGTCRVWRGPANGTGWSASNAVSPVLDTGVTGVACSGDALIRSMAAMALPENQEVIYVGTYGALDGGANIPGHIFRAVLGQAQTTMPVWQDLTLNPVTNSPEPFNYYGFDISSIFIDRHDLTGNTVYVTVEQANSGVSNVNTLYRSTDGGAHWSEITSNIPLAPANSMVVDPQNANVVYAATDAGVFFTTQVSTCAVSNSNCWSAFGTGLPEAPVVALSASPPSASPQALVAATYGRGIWQTPLWASGITLTTASTSAPALSFADQSVGTTSSQQALTLFNTGTVALTATGITITGDFAETDDCQNAPVAAGGSCAIQVEFSPTAAGARTGQITISANVYGGQLAADLTGTGIPAGLFTVTPTSLDFGNVAVGAASAPLPVDVSNASTTAIRINNIGISAPFVLVSNSCGATSVAAQSDCQMQIGFLPTQNGPATGTLTLNDGFGTQTVALRGSGGTAATDTLSPTSLTLPDTIAGQVSAAQTVQLTNSGDAPLGSIAASVSAGFRIASNNCTAQLAGHASCAIAVAFAPTQTGSQSGTLTVSDALRTQTVSLNGAGLAAPVLNVTPSSLTFSQQQPGVASAPQTVTVKNTGGAPMANVGLQISGAGASSFQVSSTTCGATLDAGSSCTAQITFTPAAAGGIAATLIVSSSTLGVNPASVTLNGTAELSSGLSASPTQLNFAAVNPGQTTAVQTVTITNTASYSIGALSLAVSAQFVLTQNGCTAALAAGAQCTAAVAFSPASNAAATGTLTITSPDVVTPASIALIGSGGIQVAPASITFPTTGAGTKSSSTTITVTNLSATDTLTDLSLTAPAGFLLVANTCTATLSAKASCTAGVEFAPTSAGQQTGNLTVTTSTVSAAPVSLSGMAFDFSVGITGSSSQTVSSGQAANYTLSLSALSGSQGTVTFACSALPSHALCAFNPASAMLNGTAQGNVAVQISTGQSTAALSNAPAGPWKAVTLVCCLFLLPLARRRRRALPTLALLAAIVCFSMVACTSSGGGGGIGGGTGGGSSATPPGTYSVQVTASSSGLQHAVTVTLTVD
ncbi:MAG TPA: choice-of-anchor D domain-containing protein [Terracidiphilus sp.]|nr:choice-of-anchor D domain-containing protein [Terracidiphilus sp.]